MKDTKKISEIVQKTVKEIIKKRKEYRKKMQEDFELFMNDLIREVCIKNKINEDHIRKVMGND